MPPPETHWYKDGGEVKTDSRHIVETLSDGTVKLTIHKATTSDVGQYKCEAVNTVGAAETSAQLKRKLCSRRFALLLVSCHAVPLQQTGLFQYCNWSI